MKGTPGAYIILFELTHGVRVHVGSLGQLDFEPGTYAYVGSALNGMEARVYRHLNGCRKKHWHIDHLLEHAEGKEALLFPSDRDIECDIAKMVSNLPGVRPGPKGFGSSDCRCLTHLFVLTSVNADELRSRAGRRLPGEAASPRP